MTEVEFNDIQLEHLEKFLLSHEEDIFDSMMHRFNDYHFLDEIFEIIVGRVPEG